MNIDYVNSNQKEDLSKTISDLRAGLIISREKKIFDEDSYNQLMHRYEVAIGVIEQLRDQINEANKKKLPSKDEVESISAMLDLFQKIDPEMINKIEKFGGKNDSIK